MPVVNIMIEYMDYGFSGIGMRFFPITAYRNAFVYVCRSGVEYKICVFSLVL